MIQLKQVKLGNGTFGTVVKERVFLYDQQLEIEVRIVRVPLRVGDWDDNGERVTELGTFFGYDFGTAAKPKLDIESNAESYALDSSR